MKALFYRQILTFSLATKNSWNLHLNCNSVQVPSTLLVAAHVFMVMIFS